MVVLLVAAQLLQVEGVRPGQALRVRGGTHTGQLPGTGMTPLHLRGGGEQQPQGAWGW